MRSSICHGVGSQSFVPSFFECAHRPECSVEPSLEAGKFMSQPSKEGVVLGDAK